MRNWGGAFKRIITRRKQSLLIAIFSLVALIGVCEIRTGWNGASHNVSIHNESGVEDAVEFFARRTRAIKDEEKKEKISLRNYLQFYNKLGGSWSDVDTLLQVLEQDEFAAIKSDLWNRTAKARAVHLTGSGKPSRLDVSRKEFQDPRETITVATVACGKLTIDMMVMLKSLVMFSRDSKLHVIIFSDGVLPVLAEAVLEFKWGLNSIGWDFTYAFHEAWFPETDDHEWERMYELCATQRLFFPSLLPETDALIYLDADTIVVSNLTEIWYLFQSMTANQIAALAPNTEYPANGHYNLKSQIPYYQPRGLNAGIMMMNLTRMRDFEIQNKSLAAYTVYKEKIKLADQDIYNIIFHAYPEKLMLLSCTYNFMWAFCGQPFNPHTTYFDERTCVFEKVPGPKCFCHAAMETGVHIIHGNSLTFHSGDYPLFRNLYSHMLKFNVLQGSFKKLLADLYKDYDAMDNPCFSLTAEKLYGNARRYFKKHGLLQ